MSDNGSGTYSVNSAGQPVVGATLIDATVFNAFTADNATAMSNRIAKAGQTTVTADISFNAKKITGLGAGTARTDAASLATIQDGTGVYVATVAGTADVITLTASPAITAYVAGQTFRFLASGANTTNVTVAINGLTAKAITKDGTTALVANDLASGAMVQITYDGTRFMLGTVASNRFLHLTGGTLTGGLVGTTGTFASLMDLSGAAAGQIKFPATQNASADTNTLDDYEEGTWTPAIGGSTTYTSQSGSYVKVGRQVRVFFHLIINVLGTGSQTDISGLPFTVANVEGAAGSLSFNSLATNIVYIAAYALVTTTTIRLVSLTAAGVSTGANNVLASGTTVSGSVTYLV